MKCARGRQQKKWRRERLWKSRGDCGRLTKNRTFHLLRKRDISNVVRMGTFLMSVDTMCMLSLTIPRSTGKLPHSLGNASGERLRAVCRCTAVPPAG